MLPKPKCGDGKASPPLGRAQRWPASTSGTVSPGPKVVVLRQSPKGEGEAGSGPAAGRAWGPRCSEAAGAGAVGLWPRARPTLLGSGRWFFQVTGEEQAGGEEEGEARVHRLRRVGGCSGVRLRNSCWLPTPLGHASPWPSARRSGCPCLSWLPGQSAYACGPGAQGSPFLLLDGSPSPCKCPY